MEMNRKKILSLGLSTALTLSLAVPAVAAEETAAPWYAEAQAYVTEKGLMTGTDKGFEPEAEVTKATVLQTLYNKEGKPEATGAELWYADAVAWASKAGVIGEFGEEDAVINRGDVKAILEAYCGMKGFESAGLMKGNEDGDMMLDKTLTRAEFAQLLVRLDGLKAVFSEEAVSIETEKRTVPAVVTLPAGEGPFAAVVINHGHGGGKDEGGGFTSLARALAKAGLASIRMDFAGCGESTAPFTENTLTQMTLDSNAAKDYLVANYPVDADRLGILGYSMGGRLALELVSKKDNPYKAVGLLSAAADDGQSCISGALGLDITVEQAKEIVAEKGSYDYATQYGQELSLSGEWFDDMVVDPLAEIDNYTGPMLVLHGDKDVVVTDEVNKMILAAYPAAQEIIVPEADHGYGFYSDQPDVTAMVENSFCAFFNRNLTEPTVTGTVTEVEKYGHAKMDVRKDTMAALGFELGDILTVTAGSYTGDMPYFDGYYVDSGEYMVRAYPSHDTIGVCINYGKFCEVAGIGVGDTITITLKEKAGALATQTIYSLVYTNDRNDYASDEVFANFRQVVMGDIAEGKLFRSCTPINNENGRAAITDDLVEKAGIKAVMNLADTAEEIAEYVAGEDFDSPYYKGLYDEGNVIVLGMPVNYASDEFAEGIVKGLTFLSEHEGPYLVHCTEGKDRAGFTAALLEALMGAELEDIVSDYMLSYVNYYHIDPETEQSKYDLIAEGNVKEMLRAVAGLEKGADLTEVDLAKAAETYLTSHGMSAEAVTALKANLKG